MPAHRRDWLSPEFLFRPPWPVLIVFILAAAALYGKILRVPFLSDDFFMLGNFFQKGFYWTWGGKPASFFRPVTVLAYWLDLRLWGLNPAGHHLMSVLLHACNAFFVYAWVRQELRKPASAGAEVLWPAFFSGALFLVLPNHTEAVSYIGGLADLIATSLFLLALMAYGRYLSLGKTGALLLTLGCLASGLLAKESVLALFPCLAVLAAARWSAGEEGRMIFKRAALTLACSAGIIAAYFLLRILVLGSALGVYGQKVHLYFSPGIGLQNLAFFALRSFLPALPAGIWKPGAEIFWMAGGAACLLAGGILPLWFLLRRPRNPDSRFLACLPLCFLCAVVPVLGLGVLPSTVENERLAYLPSVFTSVLMILGVFRLFRRRAYAVALAAVLLVAGAWSLQIINERWVAAGRLARSILDSAVENIENRKVVVMNLPDNYCGAFVFRIGFSPALRIFEPRRLFAGLVKRYALSPEELRAVLARAGSHSGTESAAPEMDIEDLPAAWQPRARKDPAFLQDLRRLEKLSDLTYAGALTFHDVNSGWNPIDIQAKVNEFTLDLGKRGELFRAVTEQPLVAIRRVSLRRVVLTFTGPPPAGTDLMWYQAGRVHVMMRN